MTEAPSDESVIAAVETVVAVAVAADALAAEALGTETAEPVAAPLTRRSRRANRPAEPAAVEAEVEVAEPVADAQPVTTVEELIFDEVPAEPVVIAAEDAQDAASATATPDEAAAATPDADAAADAFEAAARLFSFTGETAIQRSVEEPVADEKPDVTHVAPRRPRGASFKRVTAASFSLGVMGIVGLLTVGLTTPAEAVAAPASKAGTTNLTVAAGDVAPEAGEIQAYVTPSDMQSAPISRSETYTTLTMAQLAADSGISNFSNFFVNDPNSPIQWPFAVGVPISYGFGMRDGTMHEGVDFTPGEGSPIQAVADGVVRESTDSGGAFGVHIVIDHIIDGQLVSSSYSHMLYGSRQVEVGDHVTVGQIVGHTGNTGRSFGAHTHFEILMNGTTPIDPIPWLREHAGG